MSTHNPTPAVDSAELVIAGENDNSDLTTSQLSAADLPLMPADGTIVMRVKTDGRVLTITPADIAAAEKWLADNERAESEYKNYWVAALEMMRSACDSSALLTDIRANGRLEEIAASMAGHAFGTDARILFRQLVQASGVLDGLLDAERVIFQIWEEASEQPGDWRWFVRHVRELERVAGGGEPPKPGAQVDVLSAPSVLKLIAGNEIKPKPIDWLWEWMLARGKLHILAGAPGCGKTTLALIIAAILTAGGLWPDGTRAPVGNVIIWSGEDDIEDTLLPRLMAAGADVSHIRFVKGVDGRSFDPSTDMALLHDAARKLGNVGLLIVDPIVNAVAGDSHKNTETRRSLQPLVDLAQSLNAVLLGISHFTKGTAGRDPIERVTGSLAFGAVARVVFAAAKSVDEESGEEERIFVRAKSNIGPDGGGFKFELQHDAVPGYPGMLASTVHWGESIEGAARDLLKEAEGSGASNKTEDASELIQQTIREKGGEVSANDLRAALRDAGIGRDTGYRAINALLEQHRIARVRYAESGPWNYKFPMRVVDTSAFNPAASDSAANGDLVGGAA